MNQEKATQFNDTELKRTLREWFLQGALGVQVTFGKIKNVDDSKQLLLEFVTFFVSRMTLQASPWPSSTAFSLDTNLFDHTTWIIVIG